MVVSSPAVADGIVYVGSYDHFIYAFGPSPSTQTYTTSIPTSIILLLIVSTILAVGLLAVIIYRRNR
jgi:outer membrane protein assembly factor BamB